MTDSEKKENELKRIALDYSLIFFENNVELSIHIDKEKKSVKVHKKLFGR